MDLRYLKIRNHPILGNIDLDLINPETNRPYSTIAFVGENGCGKTTILNEIFNYVNSKYIVEKEAGVVIKTEDKIIKAFNVVYLRQGSLHNSALREIRGLIDGKDSYQVNSTEFHQTSQVRLSKSYNAPNNKEYGYRIYNRSI